MMRTRTGGFSGWMAAAFLATGGMVSAQTRAEDAAPAQTAAASEAPAGAQCAASQPITAEADIEAVLAEVQAKFEALPEDQRPKIEMLNNSGANYGAPNQPSIELDEILLEGRGRR